MDLNLFVLQFSFTSPSFRERRHTMQWWRGLLYTLDEDPRPKRLIKCLVMTYQFYRDELVRLCHARRR